jgi:hypothetical protein
MIRRDIRDSLGRLGEIGRQFESRQAEDAARNLDGGVDW